MQNSTDQIRLFLNLLVNAANRSKLPFKTVNFTVDGKSYPIVGWSNRAFVVVDINGVGIPFYLSSGEGGKANVPSGRWYPFFGVGSDGWLNKGTEDAIAKYYLSKPLESISKQLDSLIGDIRTNIKTLPAANYRIISDVANRDVNAVPYGDPSAVWNNINQTLVKINSDPILIPYLNNQLLLLKINKIDQAKFDKNIDLLLQNHSRKKNLILAYLQKKRVDIGKFTNQPIVASDEQVFETWSKKYKRSINCSNPKGFSQKAHCAARKKRRAGGKTKSKPVRETFLRTELLLEKIVDTLRLNGWSMLAIEDHLLARLDAKQILDENLRKWFKQKWVRFGPDGKIRGACARGSKSEGKPKCLPQAKAHALGKKGRAGAAARKRRQDPNPERRGKAKNVATKESDTRSQINLPHHMRITKNGYKLELSYDGAVIDLRVYPPEYQFDYNMRYIAYAILDRERNSLFPIDLAILDDDYKGRGIAKLMYDYLKELGFTVYRGKDQTGAGKKFWDKNRGKNVKIWEVTRNKVTKTMIHDLADKLGIPWDNEPKFLNMTQRLTGKKHLDDLTQQQLKAVYDHLNMQYKVSYK